MKKYVVSSLICIGLFAQCDPFDLEEKGTVRTENAIHDLEDAELALNGCYTLFKSAGSDLVIYPGAYADALKYEEANAFYRNFNNRHLTPGYGPQVNIWVRLYELINAANHLIERTDELEVSEENIPEKERIIAEAKFIRAYQYMHLLQFFGEVPLRLKFTDDIHDVAAAPASLPELYNQIETDLQQAAKGSQWSSFYYTSPEAATAVLARAYLYQEDWDKALTMAKEIIGNNQFSLVQNYSSIFTQLSPGEAIFYLSSESGFNRLTSSFGRGAYTTRIPLDSIFDPTDLRKEITYSGELIQKYTSGSTPLFIIRYAEVLLIAAEAAAEQGDFEAANNYYDQVRHRAGIDSLTLGPANFKEEILTERWRELFAEGPHRFIDVKRMGKAQEYWGIPEYKELWPIPQIELDENPLMRQNPRY